jgi:hypothetical protein
MKDALGNSLQRCDSSVMKLIPFFGDGVVFSDSIAMQQRTEVRSTELYWSWSSAEELPKPLF